MALITGSLELSTSTGGKYVFSKTKEGIHVTMQEGGPAGGLFIRNSSISAFKEVLHKLNDFNHVF